MPKKYNFLLLLLLCTCGISAAQEKLTREQQLADVDFLLKTIGDVSPRLRIYEQATGISSLDKLATLRAQADTLQDFHTLYKLMHKLLHITKDLHNNFTLYPTAIASSFEKANPYIADEAQEKSREMLPFGNFYGNPLANLRYVSGRYYFVQEVAVYANQEAFKARAEPAVSLKPYMELLAINGIAIDQYVSTYAESLGSPLRWDNTRKKAYTQSMALPKDTLVTLSLQDVQAEPFEVTIGKRPFIAFKGMSVDDDEDCKVLYFNTQRILYIRIPEMNLDSFPFFQNELAKYKEHRVDKVVIDVRFNGGGSDRLWKNVLSSIISEPIVFSSKLLLRNTPMVVDYMNNARGMELSYPQKTSLVVGNEHFFTLHEGLDTISPFPQSLGHKGSIYVLSNFRSFSSSLVLVAICQQSDQLVSIGQPTGYMAGRGITPFFFSLPHSKLIFELSPTLDATDVSDPWDYFHDRLEFTIEPSIEDEVRENTWKGLRYNENYLLNYDPMFKKVLEM